MEADPNRVAQLVLAGYLALGLLFVVWQAFRCHEGPVIWGMYWITRCYCLFRFHLRSNRWCPFPEEGPAIIIANHRSPVDPVFLWGNHHLKPTGRRIRIIAFMMAAEYFAYPFVGAVCRKVRTIPAKRSGRDMAAVREALRRLQRGELVGLFPEGRINPGYDLLPGGAGVAWLALHAQVPVYPVFIHGAPKGRNMIEPFLRTGRVRLVYGDPIDLSGYASSRITHDLLDEITDLFMSRLAQLGGVGWTPSRRTMRRRALIEENMNA